MTPPTSTPSLSIIIPTLNAGAFLGSCLEGIFSQDYPHSLIEILIADGGSDDQTLQIVRSFQTRNDIPITLLDNPLKTGEAGKAVGARAAKGDLVALIDSDNILPEPGWLQRMVEPFQERDMVASEPLHYVLRPEDGLITRYCALLGMNDPICLFTGNYDRYCHLTGKWTGMPVQIEERETYLRVIPDPEQMPTFGANGFVIKREILLQHMKGDFLFDIDILVDLGRKKQLAIAKVKTGIIHIFSGNMMAFAKKQKRRIMDYLYFQRSDLRVYPWKKRRKGALKFVLYCILLFPLLWQSLGGYRNRPDLAWSFHPLACLITLGMYSAKALTSFWRPQSMNRTGW